MTAITYTAKRGLIAGHALSTDYDLETEARSLDPSDNLVGSEGMADDGTTEGVLKRIEEKWGVTTGAIAAADLPAWREFLYSVAAAETFTFDAYGTIASPDNAQTVLLDGKWKISRLKRMGYFLISFTVRVAP